MSGTRQVFPESFKREAVDRVASSGLSAGAMARELGLHETVLRRWMSQFSPAQATGTPWRLNTQAVAPRRLTRPPTTPVCDARTSGCAWSATS